MRIKRFPSNINHSLTQDKIGRNDPCVCESGKKYKKRCLLNAIDKNVEDDVLLNQMPLGQNIIDRAKERYGDKNCTFGTSEEMGLVKMSDIIVEFAQDLLHFLNQKKSHKGQEQALMLAIVAWNIAVLSDYENKEVTSLINDFLQDSEINPKSEKGEAFTYLLLILIAKKRSEYAHIDRYIADFEMTKIKKDEIYLNIASVSAQKKVKKSFLSKFYKKQDKSTYG